MILFKLRGGGGNQLFQISYLLLLNKKYKYRIQIVNLNEKFIDIFQKEHIINFFYGNRNSFNAFLFSLVYKFFPYRRVTLDSCLLEYELEPIKHNVLMKGYFQFATMYFNEKPFLSEVFKINLKWDNDFFSKYGVNFKNRKVLTIHVRRGDYKDAYFPEIETIGLLPESWFEKALSKFNLDFFDNVYIVSDSPEEVKTMKIFNHPKISIEVNSFYLDFLLIYYSQFLIISNSSFAWWAAFLNNTIDKTVFAPKNWVGYNSGVEYPRGIMIPDFIWL